MPAKKPSRQLAGFVLGLLGFATWGATCAWGLVLNVEWLCNPKRRHDRFFDLVGLMLCLPGTIAFAALSVGILADTTMMGAAFPALILVYWGAWFGWVIQRQKTVWPEIGRNLREAKGDFAGSGRRESMPLAAIPEADRLGVEVRRIGPPEET